MAGAAEIAGAALAALGAGWLAWAAWWLRRAGNPLLWRAAPRRLVDDGPYRVSRHPMLLGALFAAFGVALALRSPALAGAVLSLAVLADRVVIPEEEAQLRRAFGGWYSDYAVTVRRWV